MMFSMPAQLKAFLKLIVSFFLFSLAVAAYSLETHTKFWTSMVMIGPLSKGSHFKYYLEPNLRFIDDKYKFSQGLLWAAIGYQLKPTWLVYIGAATDTTRDLSGEYTHSNILWQQASFVLKHAKKHHWFNRLRLQEIKQLHESQWHIILRERILFKYPFKSWPHHALAVSDEVFFNLKHPEWAGSNSFISQNRARIALDIGITKSMNFAVAYMNQFEFNRQRQMSHVILVAIEIKT